MDDGESGVTPIIGTILILAITVSGMGVAILVGAPVLQRMQDAAALESAIAQFEQVRAATSRLSTPGTNVEIGFAMPGGTLSIGQGTRVLVTVYEDPAYQNCDLRLRDWEDGDEVIGISFTPGLCRTIGLDNPTTCTYSGIPGVCGLPGGEPLIDCGLLGGSCFEAHKVVGGDPDMGTNYVEAPGSCPAYVCVLTVTLSETLEDNEDWLFQIELGSGTPLINAWLVHSDRLSWTRNGVATHFELGAILAQSYGGAFLAAPPPLEEDSDGNLLLRLPTWQDSTSAALSGEGLATLSGSFDSGDVLVSTTAANKVRLDFQGDLAEQWCRSMLLRSASYTEDLLDPTHNCNPILPDADQIRGVIYDDNPLAFSAFSMTLLQQRLVGDLEV